MLLSLTLCAGLFAGCSNSGSGTPSAEPTQAPASVEPAPDLFRAGQALRECGHRRLDFHGEDHRLPG